MNCGVVPDPLGGLSVRERVELDWGIVTVSED